MRSVIQWATRNSPAMNTLLIGVLVVGLLGMLSMRREVFPEFELEIILVTVPYPGASPTEIEEGICQKIEESIRSVAGLKKVTSVAQENAGFVVVELSSSVKDVQKVLNEIRSQVDRIPSFPDLAEDPEVEQITFREAAIKVGVLGPTKKTPESEATLRALTEEIRDDLLQLNTISQASILGARDYQIDIEVSETSLRKHGLTLQQVAQIVRRENVELPGGSMKTASQEVLLRGKNKRLTGEDISEIPLVTESNGVVLTVADLGTVRDEFTDTTAINEINGRPGLVISVNRTSSEDLLRMVAEVLEYTRLKAGELPRGYQLATWQDRSVDVEDRMVLLARNGLQGLVLVFLVLAIFLDLRLAFWVALGIPVSVLGACAVLFFTGQTLNMLSMFAFLLALGIVVDDAIVIGENIYSHRQAGKAPVRAAIDGAFEVLPAVSASVTTTIIAFAPLLYVSGVMGKFIAIMPVAVIAMLVISLVESTIILPCHLAHDKNLFFQFIGYLLHPFRFLNDWMTKVNKVAQRGVNLFVEYIYLPTLKRSLQYIPIVLSISTAIMLITGGFIVGGVTPWSLMPEMDSNWIHARITFPDGTAAAVTDDATRRLAASLSRVGAEYEAKYGKELVRVVHRGVGQVTAPGALGPDSRTDGSHVGVVDVELADTANREIVSAEIIKRWREETDTIHGAESLTFGTPDFGPGGTPIEFKLVADAAHMEELERMVERCKDELKRRDGVLDVRDDSRPGKWEFQLRVKDSAKAMGVTAADLAETVRAAYYGEEVMRLQRGRHEVKLMVRYPREDRRSMADFKQLRVRLQDGAERPLTELAEMQVERGFSEINRVDQKRSITVSSGLDEEKANASEIITDMQTKFIPGIAADYPNVTVRWEGQREQSQESLASLGIGFVIAIAAMFMLLTIVFRSYLQPLIILAIIPFGAVGAIWGHALLGLPISLFSVFGMVALTGVIINDSIVLIDYINRKLDEGASIQDAVFGAGVQRFRPVLLTSVTTVAGLFPMLLETSFQAQILIPMAASLIFGLIMGTVLVLILVPVFYYMYWKTASLFRDNHEQDDRIDEDYRSTPQKEKRVISATVA